MRPAAAPRFRARPAPCYSGFVAKFERHIFVCGNQRPAGHPRGSCDPTGSGELRKAFKQKLAEHQIAGTRVRANQSGCLEQCEHGPTVVVYPEAVWYGRVKLEDVDRIIELHLIGGQSVADLVLPEGCINTPSCEHKPRPSDGGKKDLP
jgi:(2Fe-2S) ferredoxin